MRWSAWILVLLVLAPGAAGQESIYVFLDGIPGESQDAAHQGWIDAFALTHDVRATDCGPIPGCPRTTTPSPRCALIEHVP